jgi:hypothetical protein
VELALSWAVREVDLDADHDPDVPVRLQAINDILGLTPP